MTATIPNTACNRCWIPLSSNVMPIHLEVLKGTSDDPYDYELFELCTKCYKSFNQWFKDEQQ